MTETTVQKSALKTVLKEIESLKGRNSDLETENGKLREQLKGRRSTRIEVPNNARATKQKFTIGGTTGYIFTGEYEDGTLGEVFLTLGKEGSLIKGLGDFASKAMSIGLQYGVPEREFIKSFRDTEFFPNGPVEGVDGIKGAKSIPDLLAKYLSAIYVTKRAEKAEAKKDAVIKNLTEEASVDSRAGFETCPSCKEDKSLKPKASGCNSVCVFCGHVEVRGCGG